MKIEGFANSLLSNFQTGSIEKKPAEGFGNVINDLISSVNESQIESNKAMENFIAGNGVELHDVMIAGEKAKTSLELLMEIRNKTVDMYKELTRMPV